MSDHSLPKMCLSCPPESREVFERLVGTARSASERRRLGYDGRVVVRCRTGCLSLPYLHMEVTTMTRVIECQTNLRVLSALAYAVYLKLIM